MLGRTHIAIGVASTYGAMALTGASAHDWPALSAALIAAGIGSLAPDLDHPGSLASLSIPTALIGYSLAFLAASHIPLDGALMAPLRDALLATAAPGIAWAALALGLALLAASWVLGSAFGHRGVVHSVAFGAGTTAVLATTLTILGSPSWPALCFGWGWLAHLLADSLTSRGLRCMWWPLQPAER